MIISLFLFLKCPTVCINQNICYHFLITISLFLLKQHPTLCSEDLSTSGNFDEECEIYTAKLYTQETTCSTGNSRV